MKFKPVIPKERWSVQQTEARLNIALDELKRLNQELNGLQSRMNEVLNAKRIIRNKISNKNKYIDQLKEQIIEISEGWNLV